MAAAFVIPRRVVVTGMGAITPLGESLDQSWQKLIQSDVASSGGMTSLEEALTMRQGGPPDLEDELRLAKTLPAQVAAPCPALDSLVYDRRKSRFVQLALIAGKEAMQKSNLLSWLGFCEDDNETSDVYLRRRERIGTCIGSGMSSVREIASATRTVEQKGYRKLSPHFVPKVLTNSAAGHLSLEYGLLGPNHSVSTACAAGSHAIGDAMRCIQYNNADIMLAGGAESCIDPLSMAGFCRLGALSTSFDPMDASRPFDKLRDGFVIGEGACVLILEELQHARARGAKILAELTGYGLTGDAFHVTSPDPQGLGAQRSMRMALEQASHTGNPGDMARAISYVNAHATSTPKGDEIEAHAINTVLTQGCTGDVDSKLPLHVSSTKGATGHLLGAAGAIEAAFTVLSLVNQIIPPTRNLSEPDSNDGISFVHAVEPIQTHGRLNAAMSNSFGFGGTNASLLFQRFRNDDSNKLL